MAVISPINLPLLSVLKELRLPVNVDAVAVNGRPTGSGIDECGDDCLRRLWGRLGFTETVMVIRGDCCGGGISRRG